MKPPPGKKLFAFIIAVMMFSTIPQLASAQKAKPCPQGYKEECHYYVCPLCARGTWICTCVPNANGKNVTYNAVSHQSIAKSFEVEHPSNVSVKTYDATGNLVRTLAGSRMPEGSKDL